MIVTLIDGREATAEQAITFTEPPLPPLPPPLPEVMITVSPSTTVAYTEEVTLTAHVLELDPLQVASYRWAHIGGSQNLSTSQSVTLGGAKWPYGPGVRRFRVFVGFTDGRQVIAEQGIKFTEPPPSQGVSVSITVSPGTTVAHTEAVTLTAHVSDPSQVKSYRWAHVGGYYKIGTQQSVTLGGSGWPHGPGTRTFQVIVTLTDETTTAAAQSITFTNP